MTSNQQSPVPERQRVALVVDGDADTRSMYAEYLRLSSAWLVEEAADGREALAKAISQRPAVVVTETRLPGMSGFDLCQLLRADTTTAGISIARRRGWRRAGRRPCVGVRVQTGD
jgi:CheY-like chemotaxis protein